MPGEFLDLSSEPDPQSDRTGYGGRPGAANASQRRFVGIRFACCDVYSRIYINREQTAYVGYCPRCTRRVNLQIGPGGTDARFFTAY
jgi:hypothetical protein